MPLKEPLFPGVWSGVIKINDFLLWEESNVFLENVHHVSYIFKHVGDWGLIAYGTQDH